jgi:hypothetical protein
MTNTIIGTYTALVTLDAAIDNPTIITTAGRLNDGLRVTYQGLTVRVSRMWGDQATSSDF